jgi:hypothetical protein
VKNLTNKWKKSIFVVIITLKLNKSMIFSEMHIHINTYLKSKASKCSLCIITVMNMIINTQWNQDWKCKRYENKNKRWECNYWHLRIEHWNMGMQYENAIANNKTHRSEKVFHCAHFFYNRGFVKGPRVVHS